jgi:hypothetical protein
MTKRNGALSCFVSLLALVCASVGAYGQAASPSFTLAASNITMPSSGFGIIPFTLTSVNGYVGAVIVGCAPQTPPAGANIPTCGAPEPYGNGFPGGTVTVNLTADSPVANHGVFIYALPASISDSWNARLNRTETEGTLSCALVGALMWGLGFPRQKRAWRRVRLSLLMVTLIGMAGIVGCVGPFPKAPDLTPGIYTYKVTAVGDSFSTSTTVTVTVPQGIVVL